MSWCTQLGKIGLSVTVVTESRPGRESYQKSVPGGGNCPRRLGGGATAFETWWPAGDTVSGGEEVAEGIKQKKEGGVVLPEAGKALAAMIRSRDFILKERGGALGGF